MKSRTFLLNLLVAGLVQSALAADSKSTWPQWRGPLGNGVAPDATPPLEWSDSKNVRWKVKIPGSGTSTPVIWGDRVFILTAIPVPKPETASPAATDSAVSPAVAAATAGQTNPPAADAQGQRPGGRQRGGGRAEKPDQEFQFVIVCLDRATGRTLWQKTARQEIPHEGHHRDHGFASASPVTDGELVFAYFGSRGLYCYDFNGNLKWETDFGDMKTRNSFGEGASPVLVGNSIVVNWDDETDNDFIVALDKRTGKELWKTKRNEETGWSTPFVVEHSGKKQIIVNSRRIRAYDADTGELIWECGGQTSNAIPTPVADADTIYAVSGFRGAAAQAIKIGLKGDLTGNPEAIRWSYNKSMPYVPSPVLVNGFLYTVSGNNGVLSCFDSKTGKPHYEAERLEGIFGIYASLVSAQDRIYVLGREGTCLVLKLGPKLEILASNKVDDKTDASIAMAGKDLFIRGHQHLYCIAEQ
ncbi:MAG TPA: PQQ-like beta-propeller repeat protein [Verrucomicrobiota bacterium]|nr:PQQ-like beta-propeller repeat protein [Verrucomicrobiota bacterium]